MQYLAIMGLALSVLSTSALAQDRTPPAGSLRALEVPIDRSGFVGSDAFGNRVEGRSIYSRTAPAARGEAYPSGR